MSWIAIFFLFGHKSLLAGPVRTDSKIPCSQIVMGHETSHLLVEKQWYSFSARPLDYQTELVPSLPESKRAAVPISPPRSVASITRELRETYLVNHGAPMNLIDYLVDGEPEISHRALILLEASLCGPLAEEVYGRILARASSDFVMRELLTSLSEDRRSRREALEADDHNLHPRTLQLLIELESVLGP